MLLSFCFLSVQASQPNVATGQTKAVVNGTLVVTLTDLFFQIFVNLTLTTLTTCMMSGRVAKGSVQKASYHKLVLH